jgi:hypothetical protein
VARFHKDMSIFEAPQAPSFARKVFDHHGMACRPCIDAQPEAVAAGAAQRQRDSGPVGEESKGLDVHPF